MIEPLLLFFRRLLQDLKSSWRFKVGLVLYIPLIITAAILTVRFGIHNTLAEKYHEWKTTFVSEPSIQFPNLMIYFANQNFSRPVTSPGVCVQRGSPSSVISVTAGGCGFNPGKTCHTFNFSPLSSRGTDVYGTAIDCTFLWNPAPGQNDEFYVHTPGGFAQQPGGNWNIEDNPVRPNLYIGFHMEPQFFHPMHSARVEVWNTKVLYETSIFPSWGTNPYNTTISFRIPFAVIEYNWETVGFDSWMLMAAWGGAFFFFYFLHSIVFSIAKLWLPDDSVLLRQGSAGESAGEGRPLIG